MITVLLVATGISVAAAIGLTAYQFTRDVRRAGGVRELQAELMAGAFPPPRPKPVQEIPGQPGWTRKQWADLSVGSTVTGLPGDPEPVPASDWWLS